MGIILRHSIISIFDSSYEPPVRNGHRPVHYAAWAPGSQVLKYLLKVRAASETYACDLASWDWGQDYYRGRFWRIFEGYHGHPLPHSQLSAEQE